MQQKDIQRLVEGTSDPAFVTDGLGLVRAWNRAAEGFFDLGESRALDQPCGSILQGRDDDGVRCSSHCAVQKAMAEGKTLSNFDLEVKTVRGGEWCNVSVLMVEVQGAPVPQALHVVRSIDASRRLEGNVRDFVRASTGLSAEEVRSRVPSHEPPAQAPVLTERETEVLRLLARGGTTRSVAEDTHISQTTVNNHVQNILRKLSAHTRLEAIRRAEHAGLV
jgi:DNA-binding CsgD family transcriptional regulator